jgi:hypothetical protein
MRSVTSRGRDFFLRRPALSSSLALSVSLENRKEENKKKEVHHSISACETRAPSLSLSAAYVQTAAQPAPSGDVSPRVRRSSWPRP